MKYGIVSSGDKAYHTTSVYQPSPLYKLKEESDAQKTWREMLARQGYAFTDYEPDIEDLFRLVREAFEQKYNVRLDIQFDKKYLASVDGLRPVPHNKGSRIFSTRSVVYVDDLMVSVLFEYITVFYLWARFRESIPIYSFCFYYATNNMNRCCRQGLLNSDEYKTELLHILNQNCSGENDRAFEFISDLYWCILAFAICHEIAHIYLGHTSTAWKLTRQEKWNEEYEADAVGYGMYLDLIDGRIPRLSSPTFLPAFHDYLYAAPMILFLFYGDLYYMGYWSFGDTIGDSHPPLESRIDRLIKISEDERYQFDTEEGNAVLSAFWDVSDTFREELFYKLKNGKLEEFIRGSYNVMGGSYEAAKSFDESMCREMRDYAEKNGLDASRMVGLYNTSVRIDTEVTGRGVVYASDDKVYSTKPFNIFFTTRRVLTAILDVGLSISTPESKVQTVMLALSILYKLCQLSTVEMTEEQARLLIACHEHGAYKAQGKSIEEEVLQREYQVSAEIVDKLSKMGCVAINDGKVSLLEEVWINKDTSKKESQD